MLGIDAVLVGRDRESKLLALTFDIFLHQREIVCQIPQLGITHPLPHVVRKRIREIEPAVTAEDHLFLNGGSEELGVDTRPCGGQLLAEREAVGDIIADIREKAQAEFPASSRHARLSGKHLVRGRPRFAEYQHTDRWDEAQHNEY